MTGRRRGQGDEDDVPGPDERRWIHPSELPADPVGPRGSAVASRARIAVPLTAGLASALAAFGLTALVMSSSESNPGVATSTAGVFTGGPGSDENPSAMTRVAQAAGPAIVGVSAWTGPRVRYGSGVVYREDGLIVTVSSLVNGATALEITTNDGRSAVAELLGTDLDNDLALLDVDLSGLSTLPFATERPTLQVGDRCILLAAGPASQEGPWAAGCVVAARGKVVHFGDHWMVDALEVDARLDPAAVGGALLEPGGVLVGILTDAGEGIVAGTLVVPATTARRSAEQLATRGRVAHPWLGLATTDTADPVLGALVREVTAEGPAAAAGVLPGDIVVHVGGREVRGMTALLREVRRLEIGDSVVLGVVRDGERIDLTATLAPRP